MKPRWTGILAVLLLLGSSFGSNAEYMLYLKGGHFIIADDCTFSAPQRVGEPSENGAEATMEECTREKKPKDGRIFWSINRNSGEVRNSGVVNADDVYDILGSKSLRPLESLRATMPLEDYLIITRGENFVNAKTVEWNDVEVYGLKRDELVTIERRSVTKIDPEGKEPVARAEGLCPGEPAEFSVTEMGLYGDILNFQLKNLLSKEWKPTFYLWVREQVQEKAVIKWKDRRRFLISELGVLPPDDDTRVSEEVKDQQFLGLLKRALVDPEVPDQKLQVCARKIKEVTKGQTAEKPSAMPSSK